MNMSISSARNSGCKSGRRAGDSSSLMGCFGTLPAPTADLCWVVATRGAERGSGSARASAPPAEPRTNGLAHDELFVGFGKPVDFQHVVDALPPGAGHFGDVRTPEKPMRAKSVVHPAVVAMQASEGIGIIGVERAARQLDGDVCEFGKGDQLGHMREGGIAFGTPECAHVIHDQLQVRVSCRDLA